MGIGMARPEPPATPFPAPVTTNKENDTGVLKVRMKSSLKKQRGCAVGTDETSLNADGIDCKRKRKVRWIDAYGQDLAQITEFEQRSSSSNTTNTRSSSAMKSNSALSWLIGTLAMLLLVHILASLKLL